MGTYMFKTDDVNESIDQRAREAVRAFAAKVDELGFDNVELIYACALVAELCYKATGQVALTDTTSAVVREQMAAR